MEAVEVVDQLAALHEPLAVELAPGALGPAGVGHGHVHALGVDAVPPLGRGEVRGGVVVAVQGHLGLARGSAREVDEHGVVHVRGDAAELVAGRAHAGVVVDPAGARAGGAKEALGSGERGAGERGVECGALRAGDVVLRAVHEEEHGTLGGIELRAGGVDDVGDGAHGGGDDGLDPRRLDAVLHVVLLEHERGGDDDGADLVQAERRDPERVVAAQDDHDLVALADALRQEEVGRLVGQAREVGKAQVVLLALGVAPDHGHALGLGGTDLVDDVVGEVEVVGHVYAEAGQVALGVEGLGAVALVDVEHVGHPLCAWVAARVARCGVLARRAYGRGSRAQPVAAGCALTYHDAYDDGGLGAHVLASPLRPGMCRVLATAPVSLTHVAIKGL